MLLTEVESYLQNFHIEMEEKILLDLKEKKQTAVNQKDELLANKLWCLIETFGVQSQYVNMFQQLKSGNYEDAWSLIENIDISLGYLRVNFNDGDIYRYKLAFVDNMIKKYVDLFPYKFYLSRECIIKSERCNICGKTVTLRNGCNHIPGRLYMGELCLREITDCEIKAISIVNNPKDKFGLIHIKEQDYNYTVLDKLMAKLESPFRAWNIEID